MRRNGRLKGSVVILVLGLLVSACFVELQTRCTCPNLEAVAPTIDWIGRGEAPVTIRPVTGPGGFRHRVDLHYASSDELVDLDAAVMRLSAAGFRRTDDSDQSFRGEEWRVILQAGTGDELVVLFVEITDDERAEEILQPLIDALGTVP